MDSESNLPVLTPLQATYIAVAMRYRVVLAQPVKTIVAAPTEEAAEKSLKRLKQDGWLYQLRLPGRKACYTLTQRAVRILGLSKKALKHMGQSAVIANLAMLWFCARTGVERLTPDEVRDGFPELEKPGLQVGNYFTDSSVTPARLTWMMVDRGSSPTVLVRKAGNIVKKSYRFPCLKQLVQESQFAIVILVPGERKKWLVDQILANRYFPQVTVSVHVVPEIEDLLLS